MNHRISGSSRHLDLKTRFDSFVHALRAMRMIHLPTIKNKNKKLKTCHPSLPNIPIPPNQSQENESTDAVAVCMMDN